jgi:hypothetical protein
MDTLVVQNMPGINYMYRIVGILLQLTNIAYDYLFIEPHVPSNVTAVMPHIHPNDNTTGSLNITLEWIIESDTMHLGHNNQISNYTVTVYPGAANSGSIFHTANTSIPLSLNYDRDYNISVVASNCVGNSTPAEIHIRLGKLRTTRMHAVSI